jgi:hypothetical protein
VLHSLPESQEKEREVEREQEQEQDGEPGEGGVEREGGTILYKGKGYSITFTFFHFPACGP